MKKYIISILFYLCAVPMIMAQSDTVGRGHITIVRPYKPKIQDAIKKAVTPLPETALVSMPPFAYNFNSIEPNFQINTPGYRAINLPQEKINALNGNFTKLGFGNYNSPFLEVSLNNLRSRNWSMAANARHYSLNGKSIASKYSNNQLLFAANYTGEQTISGVNLLYNRDMFRYYAQISDKTDTLAKGALLNPYHNIQLNAYTSSKKFDSSKVNYRLDFKYDNVLRKKDVNEQSLLLGGDVRKIVRGNIMKANLILDFDQYINDTEKYNRNFVKIQPEYNFGTNAFKAILGFNAILLHQNRDTVHPNQFQFYPKLLLEYTLNKKYKIYTGIHGDWEKYTLKNIYQVNPFLAPNIRLDNSKNFHLNIGVKGHVTNDMDVSMEARYTNMSNLLIYTLDSTYLHAMDLIQLSASVKRIKLDVHYHLGNKIDIYSSLSYNQYKITDTFISRASQLPPFEWKNSFVYKLGDKIYTNLQINYTGARYMMKYNSVSKSYDRELMKPFTDISLNADYRYSKYVSMFLNVNNIISNKYKRWYGYPVVGINVQLGLTITL